jgi:UDP-2,3-diacylglucosamine hydrolase
MAGQAPDPLPVQIAGIERLVLHDPLLISDLHLNAGQPKTLARFLRFCAEDAARHAELVILGDLFEYWIGDDTLDDPDDNVSRTVTAALHDLTDRGVKLYVMHGNRDLLLGARFCAQAGARLLVDPTLADIAGTPTLLAHGDAYCTQDTDYMQFRAQVRDPDFQRMFLAKPLAERRAFIGQARSASEAGKAAKAMDIMDVTPAAIEAAFAASGATHMIHGHTHRPALHRLTLGGRACERWVLPDWDFDATPSRGGYLSRVDGQWQTRPVALPA